MVDEPGEEVLRILFRELHLLCIQVSQMSLILLLNQVRYLCELGIAVNATLFKR